MRKYVAIPKSVYDEILETYSDTASDKKGAFQLAEDLQERLTKDNDGESIPVVLIEEVGVLQASEIVRKVKRSFTASRSIERKPKEENGETSSEENTEDSNSDAAPRKRGRKARNAEADA